MALAYRRDSKTTEPRIPATDARVHFGELLQHVTETEETVVVERNGREVAAIVPIDAYRRQRPGQPEEDWRESLRQSREAFKAVFRDSTEPLNAAALIREGRDDYEDWLAWDPQRSTP